MFAFPRHYPDHLNLNSNNAEQFDRTVYVNQKVCSVLCFGMFNKCIRPDNIMILKFLRIEFLFLEQTRFLVLKMVLAWLTIQLSLYNLFDLLKLRNHPPHPT